MNALQARKWGADAYIGLTECLDIICPPFAIPWLRRPTACDLYEIT
jgi:hypothetical protein